LPTDDKGVWLGLCDMVTKQTYLAAVF